MARPTLSVCTCDLSVFFVGLRHTVRYVLVAAISRCKGVLTLIHYILQ
jgi:hypothetical protein